MHINRYIFIYVQRVCNVINGGGTEYYPIVLWDHPAPPIYRYPRSSPNGNRTKYPQEADLVFSDLHSRPQATEYTSGNRHSHVGSHRGFPIFVGYS